MKKQLISLLVIILSTSLLSKVPQKMSYQAVVRNVNNNPIENTTIGIRISILQGSVSGNSIYSEIQTPTTNQAGLISLEIGGGTPIIGTFSSINWQNGPFFIKTETDILGGTDYTITGTSQLLSVPFALHAQTAQSASPNSSLDIELKSKIDTAYFKTTINQKADTSELLNYQQKSRYFIGQFFCGGIIFHIDNTGNHGLIMSLVNIKNSYTFLDASGHGSISTNYWDGLNNTNNLATLSMANGAGGINDCYNYTNLDYETGIFSDWYCPSIEELQLIYKSQFILNKCLRDDNNSSTQEIEKGYYYSSTSIGYTSSTISLAYFNMLYGGKVTDGTSNNYRPVRRF